MSENNSLEQKENSKKKENKLVFKSFSDFKSFIEGSEYTTVSSSKNEIVFKFPLEWN